MHTDDLKRLGRRLGNSATNALIVVPKLCGIPIMCFCNGMPVVEVVDDYPPSFPRPPWAGDSNSDGEVRKTVAIVSATVLLPVVALVALICCWRRRKQKQADLKGPSATVSFPPRSARRAYGPDGKRIQN